MPQTPSPKAPLAWSLPGGLIEKPGEYPGEPELWCYTDEFSYRAGDEVGIKVHSTAATFDIEIIRDGHSPTTVYDRQDIPGIVQQTPPDSYAVGCGWTDALTVTIDPAWSPGFYLMIVRTRTADGRLVEREGFFLVRNPTPAEADFVLIHATSTVLAYNDWGGANHYRGLPDSNGGFDTPTPISSARRPIAHGMLRKPIGVPREAHHDVPPPHWTPRYPNYEWAWHNGYSRHHADAGWATYERPFTVWAEHSGYTVAHISQTDLHRDPDALDGYRCAVAVGHDEYWTWEMRDRVDQFVETGGGFARFGGNYLWQVRLDADGTQTCYKNPHHDPMTALDPTRSTTAWDWPPIGRPGAATMGLTGLAGIYNRYGPTTPRSSGGFTVYRPDHWALEGSDLYYGDVFGGLPVCVAAFEMEGSTTPSAKAGPTRPESTAHQPIWRSSPWRLRSPMPAIGGTARYPSGRPWRMPTAFCRCCSETTRPSTSAKSSTAPEWSPTSPREGVRCSTPDPPSGSTAWHSRTGSPQRSRGPCLTASAAVRPGRESPVATTALRRRVAGGISLSHEEGTAAKACGRRTVNTVRPGADSSAMLPWWARTTADTIARPRPVEPSLRERDVSARANRSNTSL